MPRTRHALLGLLPAALLAAAAAQAQAPPASKAPAPAADGGFAAMQQQVVEHTLRNGLRLILLPRHEVPVFSFVTLVNVGSVDEHVGIGGIAHMFEHMAFKGTTRIGTKDYAAEKRELARVDQLYQQLRDARHKNESAERIQTLEQDLEAAQKAAQAYVETNEYGSILDRFGAAQLNASTSFDHTTYYYSLPSNKLELWMSLESDRFVDPVLREFYKERDVVKEERFMRIDSSPFGRLLEEFLGAAYLYHPYGNLGIGSVSDLSSFTREEAEAFYREHYVPSNIIVAVVGDVDPKEAIRLAEAYFGRIPAGPHPEPVETIEPEQKAERKVTIFGQSQRIAILGYHKPHSEHPDEPVYEMIAGLLSAGRTSRLYRKLVQDTKIATVVEGLTGFPGNKYPNLFCFYALPAPGHTNEKVLAAIDAELERLENEPVAAAELDRVKAMAKSSFIQGLSSNLGMAIQLATHEALSGDWRELFHELDEFNAVTAADVQRVARTTFVRTNRTIALLEPEEQLQKTADAAAPAPPAASASEPAKTPQKKGGDR